MKLVLALCCLAVWPAQADPLMESVQRALKDRGFYYGEITGQKDADTSAAIRRYQIRNGLKITGDLNPETQKSLGTKGSSSTRRDTAPPREPAPARPSEERDEATAEEPSVPRDAFRSPTEAPTYPAAPEIGAPAGGLFAGTPFARATFGVQQRVIMSAQALLARRGYYQSEVDGIFGAGTAFALRAYQARFGLEPSGRFDIETLASLGLLPGQRAPGLTAPRRRIFRRPPPSDFGPNGERIYIPR